MKRLKNIKDDIKGLFNMKDEKKVEPKAELASDNITAAKMLKESKKLGEASAHDDKEMHYFDDRADEIAQDTSKEDYDKYFGDATVVMDGAVNAGEGTDGELMKTLMSDNLVDGAENAALYADEVWEKSIRQDAEECRIKTEIGIASGLSVDKLLSDWDIVYLAKHKPTSATTTVGDKTYEEVFETDGRMMDAMVGGTDYPELRQYSTLTIQQKLNEFGFGLVEDGLNGKNTTRAIEDFGVDFLAFELENSAADNIDFTAGETTDGSDYIDFAMGEVGQKEVVGGGSNPRILEYFKACGLSWVLDDSKYAYCACGLSFVFKSTGYSVHKGSASALSWAKFGKETPNNKPVYGAVGVKHRGSPNSGLGHTVLVIGQSDDGKYLNCISFNSHDQVMLVRYRANSFFTFRVPNNYEERIPLTSSPHKFAKAGKES